MKKVIFFGILFFTINQIYSQDIKCPEQIGFNYFLKNIYPNEINDKNTLFLLNKNIVKNGAHSFNSCFWPKKKEVKFIRGCEKLSLNVSNYPNLYERIGIFKRIFRKKKTQHLEVYRSATFDKTIIVLVGLIGRKMSVFYTIKIDASTNQVIDNCKKEIYY